MSPIRSVTRTESSSSTSTTGNRPPSPDIPPAGPSIDGPPPQHKNWLSLLHYNQLMVKVKSNGLSVVAAFFGNDDSLSEIKSSTVDAGLADQEAIGTKGKSHGKGENKNLGVGAVPKVDVVDQQTDTVAPLLKLVRGRKRSNQQDEEEVDVNVDQAESEDDNEEEGRTAVGKKKEVAQTNKDTQPKKKKLKKKDQSCNKINEVSGDECKNDVISSTTTKSFQTDKLESLASYRKQRLLSNDGPASSMKRTKVRSKQKNIRKDTRGHKKPSHLIPGRSDFTGRGLTAATRAYLGLPAKTKHADVEEHLSQGGNLSHRNNHALSDLAVDSLLVDVRPNISNGKIEKAKSASKGNNEEEQSVPKKDTQGRKKATRSKYKNLIKMP